MRRKRWLLGGVLLLLAALIFVLMTPVYHVVGEHCWYTLSRKGHTEWPFGIESSYRVGQSPLEEYLAENAPEQLEHDWHYLFKTGKTVYGGSIVFHDYRRSPALRLTFDDLDRWIEDSDRDEILKFYEVLKSGDYELIEERVDEILERVRSY